MKHIKTFESFLNEENSSNLNEGSSFDEIKDKYKDNPYGIGAQSVEYVEGANGNPAKLIFRHDERGRRDQIESKLKSMGIPAKKLSKATADKAFAYRYELHMYENENFINESSGEIVFSVNDDKLDNMLNNRFSSALDFKDVKGDSYYVLNNRDFDRFIDLADSSGFDVDYENSEESVIDVIEQ
jgi:hypothetical protein